jgi:hypothetical protein
MAKEPVTTLRELNRRAEHAVRDCEGLLLRSKRVLREARQDSELVK